MLRSMKLALPLLLMCVFALVSRADTVICTETSSGCSAVIPTSSPELTVASDGESSFDPVGAGFDLSDYIMLNSNWVPDPAFAAAFATGFWTELPDSSTWVLPANTPCGNENEPACEPIAKWDFAPGSQWGTIPGVLDILDEGGGVSDVISAINNGPNGEAAITFASDPNVVPEPSLGLLTGVLCGVVFYVRKRRAA